MLYPLVVWLSPNCNLMRTSISPFFDRRQQQLLIKCQQINLYAKHTIHFKSKLLFYRLQKNARCDVRLRRNEFGFFSNHRTCFCGRPPPRVPGLPPSSQRALRNRNNRLRGRASVFSATSWKLRRTLSVPRHRNPKPVSEQDLARQSGQLAQRERLFPNPAYGACAN